MEKRERRGGSCIPLVSAGKIMKQTRKMIASILVIVMLVSCIPKTFAEPADRFTDVPGTSWFYTPINYVLTMKWFSGVSDTEFRPNSQMNRAMMVTVLWRLAGSPKVSQDTGFTDVPKNAYYHDAVNWAYQENITKGKTEKLFCPNEAVDRSQILTFLYRYAELITENCNNEAINVFPDTNQVPNYAKKAVNWAIRNTIITGSPKNGINYINPERKATRAEVAKMLMTFYKIVIEENEIATYPNVKAQLGYIDLWLDGIKFQDCPIYDGEAYIPLSSLGQLKDVSYDAMSNIRITINGYDTYIGTESDSVLVDGSLKKMNGKPVFAKEWYIPASYLERVGFAVLDDTENTQRFYTRIARSEDMPENVSFPIITYHHIGYDPTGNNTMYVTPEDFRDQMEAIHYLGYTAITFEDFKNLKNIKRPIMVMFDDGYRDNYTNAFPIMKEYGIKATLFMVGKSLDNKEQSLTSEMLKEMSDSGYFSIQSHTFTHSNMATFPEEELRYEFNTANLIIARATGKIPFALSYPTGSYNALVINTAARYYQFAVTANTGRFDSSQDVMRLKRHGVYSTTTMTQFISMIS